MNAMTAVASGLLLESQGITLIEGYVVRMVDPTKYISSFSKSVAGRDTVVLWVGSTKLNMFHGQACVKFLKRNGRGKEFQKGPRLKKPSASAGAFRLRGLTLALSLSEWLGHTQLPSPNVVLIAKGWHRPIYHGLAKLLKTRHWVAWSN